MRSDINNARPALNFEEDLKINVNRLDEEWEAQPNLFFAYAAELAKARKAKDLAKKNLLIARARVREALQASGGKCTEASIEEALARTPEYDAYDKACTDEDYIDGAVKAMYQRKEALQEMVKLIQMQYLASPKEPRPLGRSAEKERADSRVGSRLRGEK